MSDIIISINLSKCSNRVHTARTTYILCACNPLKCTSIATQDTFTFSSLSAFVFPFSKHLLVVVVVAAAAAAAVVSYGLCKSVARRIRMRSLELACKL